MSVTSSIRIAFENLRSLSYSQIASTYAGGVGLGTPTLNPARQIKITNFTNSNLIISLNGVNDMDAISAGGFVLYDFGSNKADAGGVLELPASTRFYVRYESMAPTLGNVYLTIIYASQM